MVRYETDFEGAEIGGIWDAVGRIGAAAAQTTITNLFGATGTNGQARGLAAIEQFGQQVLQTLAQIAQAVQSGQLPREQAVQEAGRIASLLGNSQYVYQAQRGNDAAALQSLKQQAAAMVEQIRGLAAGSPAAPRSVPGPAAVSLNASPILLIGGGLLLMMLLKR